MWTFPIASYFLFWYEKALFANNVDYVSVSISYIPIVMYRLKLFSVWFSPCLQNMNIYGKTNNSVGLISEELTAYSYYRDKARLPSIIVVYSSWAQL